MTATGKSLPQRLAEIDAWGGAALGRGEIGHALGLRDGGVLSNGDGNQALIRKLSPARTIKLVWQQPDTTPDTPDEVKFEPAGARTTVIVTHERLQTRADADGLRRAWGEALERLKAVIED